ncbi:MAG: ATP-binding protein [Oscillospiraceae bacterium]|nr:ATP-binding protein [Oscillospiraceae bacterium]
MLLNGAVWAFWIVCLITPLREWLSIIALVLFFLLSLPYTAKWHIKIILSIFVYMLSFFSEWAFHLLLGIIMQLDVMPHRTNELVSGLAYLAYMFTSYVTVLAIIKIITHKKAGNYSNISIKTFIAPPVMLGLIVLFMFWFGSDDGVLTTGPHIMMIVVLLIILVWVLLIVFSRKVAENEAVKRTLIFTSQQIDHYKYIEQQQAEIRKLSHNMKNYMTGLLGLMQEGDLNEINNYVEEVTDDINLRCSMFDTGHFALDAVLQLKKQRMDSMGILFDTSVHLPGQLAVDVLDLCVIVGNGLDNAIEACDALPEGEARYIRLRMKVQSQYISICIENSTKNKHSSNKIPKTTKSDGLHHGFGLATIKGFAKKYNGDFHVNVCNQMFTLAVMLKNA